MATGEASGGMHEIMGRITCLGGRDLGARHRDIDGTTAIGRRIVGRPDSRRGLTLTSLSKETIDPEQPANPPGCQVVISVRPIRWWHAPFRGLSSGNG